MMFKFKAPNQSHKLASAKATAVNTAFVLTRRFALTGDERCPIAGIWSRLDECSLPDSTDEPCIAPPAMGTFSWRAIHLLFTSLRYLPA
jgi:hypothetical protein